MWSWCFFVQHRVIARHQTFQTICFLLSSFSFKPHQHFCFPFTVQRNTEMTGSAENSLSLFTGQCSLLDSVNGSMRCMYNTVFTTANRKSGQGLLSQVCSFIFLKGKQRQRKCLHQYKISKPIYKSIFSYF